MAASSYFPRAYIGLKSGSKDVSLPTRPQAIGPVLDALSTIQPLAVFDAEIHGQSYSADSLDDGTSKMPPKPKDFSDPYLYPMLTRNERLRLTMLWYYTKELISDREILEKLQAKVDLLIKFIGWEFAICGLLENDIYQRVVTVGLPLAILPRRESTCSHTVQQSADSVFFVSDMSNDWRFAQSPHVLHGGLRTYAGAQLRCKLDNGEDIALGSLCIASNTPNQTLSASQLDMLAQFADMLTEDIVNGSRRKRAKQQEDNEAMLREAFVASLSDPSDDLILKLLDRVFPKAQISLLPIKDESIRLQAEGPSVALSSLQGESVIWEDHDLIEEQLRMNNQDRLRSERPVRAIIARVRDKPSERALVVFTNDITRIFDDVDIRFMEGCAMVIRNIAQETSLLNASKAWEQFMRGITHQLRTPIHGILGSVDLLTDEIFRDGQVEAVVKSKDNTMLENLKMIKSSGRELMSTVNNVIKFNRWTESATYSKFTTLSDLNTLESEILDGISWLLPEDRFDHVSIFFNNRVPPEVSMVRIDMTLLMDCLQSLVLNALQNTMQGSVVVTISAPSDYSSIIFDIEDTGCGIAPADRHGIFEAYAKGNTHSTGAGLGLTIACRIADALSGAVTLESSVVDQGSHFRAEFRNPGFACPRAKTRASITTENGLPERFFLIPSDHPAQLDKHFALFLKARGMMPSGEATGALAVVSFAHSSAQYQSQLAGAADSPIAISLVPAGANLSDAKTAHSNTLFFSGPFTSDRLEAILLETRSEWTTRRMLLTTQPTLGTDTENGSLSKLDSSLPPSCPSSKRGSIAPRNCVPQCLLVDDNSVNLRIMRMFCDKRGLPYRTALDGLQAIDEYKRAMAETPISLILLDLQMPKCDGILACEEIRAIEAREGLQPAVIFIVTGQDSPSDRKRSFAAGADQFFVKPLALKSLDRGIVDIFGKA